MTNPLALLSQPYLSQILTRKVIDQHGASAAKPYRRELLTTRVLSTLGCLAGLTAILAGCSSSSVSNAPSPIPTVSGESITAEEVESYAKAVLAIEGSRQAAYNEIQQLTNNERIPDVTCTQADTIKNLATNIQDIAVNYCNQSKKIGESHGLTIAQFNAITVSAQADTELQKRIQNELLRLQR